jgi:predicted transposase YdaD
LIDKELIMRLEPLYQRDREQAVQEGKKQGEQRLVIRQLNRRIGEIDTSLIERIQGLSIEELENLGEALLDFSSVADLETWLNQ